MSFSFQFSFIKYLSVQVNVNIWNHLESNVLRESGQGALGVVWSEGGLELGTGEMLREPASWGSCRLCGLCCGGEEELGVSEQDWQGDQVSEKMATVVVIGSCRRFSWHLIVEK